MAQAIKKPYKINGDLVVNGDVSSYEISSNSRYVVYFADQDTNGSYELFSVPIKGGIARRLSGSLASAGRVIDYQISLDGSRVVYKSGSDINNEIGLFSVPITGQGTSMRLATYSASDYGISDFEISADGRRVVYYLSTRFGVSSLFLYSVAITGGTNIRLDLGLQVNNGDFSISSDSKHVVFRADRVSSPGVVAEIFSVPITGGTPVRLNHDLFDFFPSFHGIEISPDGANVVYRVQDGNFGAIDFYNVPITGGTPKKLNGNQSIDIKLYDSFEVDSKSSRVVFKAEPTNSNASVDQLYSTPIEGGNPVRLDDNIVDRGINNVKISPNATRVTYTSGQLGNTKLFSVPIRGGTPVHLNRIKPSNSNIPIQDGATPVTGTQISPLSNRIVYLTEHSLFGAIKELASVPITGGTPIRLNAELARFGSPIFDFQITPDGTRVLYLAHQVTDDTELFIVPISGGSPIRLNTNLPSGGNIKDFLISSDGQFVVYSGEQDVNGQTELFAVRILEAPAPTPVDKVTISPVIFLLMDE